MKILITGSNGLLGQKILHKLRVDKTVKLIDETLKAEKDQTIRENQEPLSQAPPIMFFKNINIIVKWITKVNS